MHSIRSRTHVWLAPLIAVSAFMSGCGDPRRSPPAPTSQQAWLSAGGELAAADYRYVNRYSTWDKYPGYGIVEYEIDERYTSTDDPEHIRKALERCRAELGQAYREGTLRYSSAQPPFDRPFELNHVIVAIQNRREHRGASTFASSYKVAYLFEADKVFAEDVSLPQLIEKARADRQPIAYGVSGREGGSPSSQIRWLIVERHQAEQATPAAKPAR